MKRRIRRAEREQRRQEAIRRYLAGERIESICRSMRCSTRWLYKWRDRYSLDNPVWYTERERTPKTVYRTSGQVEQVILKWHRTGLTGPQIRERLKQEGVMPLPSLRTVYRVIKRSLAQ